MDREKDLAEKIYWILIKEGQDYLASIPLGQRMFFTAEDVKKLSENIWTNCSNTVITEPKQIGTLTLAKAVVRGCKNRTAVSNSCLLGEGLSN